VVNERLYFFMFPFAQIAKEKLPNSLFTTFKKENNNNNKRLQVAAFPLPFKLWIENMPSGDKSISLPFIATFFLSLHVVIQSIWKMKKINWNIWNFYIYLFIYYFICIHRSPGIRKSPSFFNDGAVCLDRIWESS